MKRRRLYVYEERRPADWLAPPLMLMAPLVSSATYHEIPLWRPDMALALGCFALAALAVTLLARLRRATFQPLALALLVLAYGDLQFGLGMKFALLARLFGAHAEPMLQVVALAAIGGLFAGAWLMRRHLAEIAVAIFGTIILTTLLVPAPTISAGAGGPALWQAGAAGDLPPVLHIILDEHIGIAGIPQDIAGGPELRRDLQAFYLEYGFALYGRAFSHYFNTVELLSNLVAGTVAETAMSNLAQTGADEYSVRRNPWFTDLRARGHLLRVRQTSLLDFCGGPAAAMRCTATPGELIAALTDTEVGVWQRARFILNAQLDRSAVRRVAVAWAAQMLRPRLGPDRTALLLAAFDRRMAGPLLGRPLLDEVAAEMAPPTPGVAQILHVLLPHRDYLFDARCVARPDIDQWQAGGHWVLDPASNTPATRAAAYRAYFDQVRCTMAQLRKIFDAMREAGRFAAATIIVHGDHGSRIGLIDARETNAGRLSAADLIDGYSALFAFKAPGVVPGYRTEQRSIQALFAELVLGRRLPAETRRVFLEPAPAIAGRKLVALEMPDLVSP